MNYVPVKWKWIDELEKQMLIEQTINFSVGNNQTEKAKLNHNNLLPLKRQVKVSNTNKNYVEK